MQNRSKLRSFKIALCASAALAAGAPAFAQHVRVGYAGGWHGGYGWRGGYYGGYRGGYYGGWRGGYYGGYRGGYYYGPWGWWGGYGLGLGLGLYYATLPYYYSTYWWGGIPYYYADNTYYRWNGTVGQYETVAPPQGLTNQGGAQPADPSQPAGPSQLVVYPKNGQS